MSEDLTTKYGPNYSDAKSHVSDKSTKYGVAIGLVNGKELYLSRRSEKVVFGKKWQLINGRLRGSETSKEAALRLVWEHTNIPMSTLRFHDVGNIHLAESHEFYYVYLVHLRADEKPVETTDHERWRGPWRSFPLDRAVVLDLVPGVRNVIKKLYKSLKKVEASQLTEKEKAAADAIYDQQRELEMSEFGCYGC